MCCQVVVWYWFSPTTMQKKTRLTTPELLWNIAWLLWKTSVFSIFPHASSVLPHRGNECANNISDTLPYWIPSHFFSSPNFYITCDWMHTQKAQGKLESIYYRYFKKYYITGFKWCYWKWKSCLSTKVQTWEFPLLQPKFRIIKCSCRILKWQLIIGELKAINILYKKK